MTPLATILHKDAIRGLVDARTFERGQDYFAGRRVVGLSRQEATLVATVRGTTDYRVRLWVKDSGLAFTCTCPMGKDGLFCKHGVAVGLAWLAQDGYVAVAQVSAADLRARLLRLDKDALVALLIERATVDPTLRDLLLAATAE
jgi:uncharacterized Zn finger protein